MIYCDNKLKTKFTLESQLVGIKHMFSYTRFIEVKGHEEIKVLTELIRIFFLLKSGQQARIHSKIRLFLTKVLGPWPEGGVIISTKWIGFRKSMAHRPLR